MEKLPRVIRLPRRRLHKIQATDQTQTEVLVRVSQAQGKGIVTEECEVGDTQSILTAALLVSSCVYLRSRLSHLHDRRRHRLITVS